MDKKHIIDRADTYAKRFADRFHKASDNDEAQRVKNNPPTSAPVHPHVVQAMRSAALIDQFNKIHAIKKGNK